MIRWPLYPAEVIAYGLALFFTILMVRRKAMGAENVSIVQVPIILKIVWSSYLCYLAIRVRGDIVPSHTLATITQSLTFLLGLCLAILFAKRLWGSRHE